MIYMPKGDDLTLKQRKWMKLYLECGNATEAAMKVYDCKNRDVARQIGLENIAKLDYTDFMEEAGITDNLLQEKIMEGLDANRTISAKITIKNQDKGANSQTNDFIDVPDFIARHKYLEIALKLKQRLIDRKLHGEDKENPFKGVVVLPPIDDK